MRRSAGTWSRERPAALALAGLLAVLALAAPAFFSPANVRDVVMANAAVQIVALGMTLVILTGEVDVSVGAAFGLCAVVFGLLAQVGLPVTAAAIVAIMCGGLVGLVNGVLIGGLGLPSIVVTLALLAIIRDAQRWATEGAWVRDLPATFQWLGLGQARGEALVIGATALLVGLLAWMLRSLAAGRAIFAAGSDAESARLAGLRPTVIVGAAFVACGMLTGLAAVLNAIRFAEVPGALGAGLELKTIAAVIVGGTAITGGRGSIAGTVIGVALLGAIGTGLTFLGISAYWERALQGAIILAALVSDRALSRARSAVA
jgi:rhamnose transport system permease protein